MRFLACARRPSVAGELASGVRGHDLDDPYSNLFLNACTY